jgi:hypothetical protein
LTNLKIAVLNNSGNVGKTTIARHLLSPRMGDCPIFFVESINEGGDESNFKGRNFADVLAKINQLDSAVVDIGSSNIEAVYEALRKMHQAHEDFDFYVIPTVPATKQQRDTAKTIDALLALGVPASKLRLVFNMVEFGDSVAKIFPELVAQAQEHGIPTDAVIPQNELYELISTGSTVAENIISVALLKEKLAAAQDTVTKQKLATAIGISRLAKGVQDELDSVFAALFPMVTENATSPG